MQPLRRIYYRTGLWKVTLSCSERFLLYIREGPLDLSKESRVSCYFLRHWVGWSITRAIDRQAQHLPVCHTIRRHFSGTPSERSSTVCLVLKILGCLFTRLTVNSK